MAWDVWFNGADSPGDPTTAINSSGVAQNQTASLNESGSTMLFYCQSISAAPAGFGVYRVTAYFATTPKGWFPNPAFPTSEPKEYLFEPASTSEPVDRDIFGNVIANTNNDVYQSLPSKFFPLLNLTIRYNVALGDFDMGGLETYQCTVNGSAWTFGPSGAWSVDAGEAFCKGIRPITEVTNQSPYIRLEGQWELRPGIAIGGTPAIAADSDGLMDGFKYRVLNAGRRCYFNSGSGPQMGDVIYKASGLNQGLRVQDDIRFNVDGTPVDGASYAVMDAWGNMQVPIATPGFPTQPITTEVIGTGVMKAVFIHYQLYATADYNDLDLDT
jgi:hypothetical protein